MKPHDFKPPIGNDLYEAKRQMLEGQDERRKNAQPISQHHAVVYARELLSVLDKSVRGPEPSRIDMSGPPPLEHDRLPNHNPEPIGGCFSDLLTDPPVTKERDDGNDDDRNKDDEAK